MYYKRSCPVPKEQRPINEYIELVRSDFFNWPLLSEDLYKKKIIQAYTLSFVVSVPFSNLFCTLSQSLSQSFAITIASSALLMLFISMRLLLGWNYIQERLYKPTVFYEESGWYDGHIWVKSKNILVQDRLICTYQVVPVLKKLKNLIFCCCFLLISCLILIILN